ncbi:oligopeptide:H+ symporter [Amycolatopsis minnesotensis]|uniref:Peptide MFS transporter n=1 Tax=Amycolatopsis minnesotensis TaxID=337894 RepID=A0ABP5BEK9_9PSEU
MSTSTEVKRDGRFFGHPLGLTNLFGVELWERFSFYGMIGILPIYLYYSAAEGGLDVARPTALGIVGAYSGLVYLSSTMGSWVADRLLGSERTLFYSAILVMVGHIGLAVVPGLLGVGIGLVCVAVGSGGLKANATTIVGTLYEKDDPRIDAGFTIFYIGVNVGGWLGPLLTGLAQEKVNFHLGFGLAAIGMALGLVQYTLGRKNLGGKASEVPNPLPPEQRVRFGLGALAGVVVIVAVFVSGLVTAEGLPDAVLVLVGAVAVIYFAVILSSGKITADERSRVWSFVPMFIASAAFFSLYQQQATVVIAYSDERLDRNLFGWEMPVSWTSSINPVFIILLGGVFATIWTKLGNRQPSTPAKFAYGTIIMGIAFLLFLPMIHTGENGSPLLALIGILFVFTIGEMMLSPVGLAVSTKLAPTAFRSQMVALNFLSISFGSAMSGKLAQNYSTTNEGPYFGVIGGVAIAIGVVLALCIPFIRKQMKGVH